MPGILRRVLRKIRSSKRGNLVSFENPYRVIAGLLKERELTGIIDAGASNGRISRRLLRLFPKARVYGFEPNPDYAGTLLRLAEESPRFVPQFMALTDSDGPVDLYVTQSPGTTSLFTPSRNLTEMYPDESRVRNIEQVQAVTLDSWAQENTTGIQLIKFDIQGGELRALAGAAGLLQKSVLVIYTEVLFNPLYEGGAVFSEIDMCLRKNGFVLYDIYKPRYNTQGKLLWANAIFIHAGRLGL